MDSKSMIITIIGLLCLAIILLNILSWRHKKQIIINTENAKEVSSSTMKLSSLSFKNGTDIPSKYTCDDINISPSLSFSDIPSDTKSLVIIVDDPDSPSGDWVHWLIWNIDANISQINEGEVPSGAGQGMTDFKENKYGGPCPGAGKHKYQFKTYALDTSLNLDTKTTKQQLIDAMEGHIIDQAMLVGYYQRN